MAIKAKYTQPIQVVSTPDMRAEVFGLSDAEERSMAAVLRDLIQVGLDHPEAYAALRDRRA